MGFVELSDWYSINYSDDETDDFFIKVFKRRSDENYSKILEEIKFAIVVTAYDDDSVIFVRNSLGLLKALSELMQAQNVIRDFRKVYFADIEGYFHKPF